MNNQPFCESALHEFEKREGAGTLFVQSKIAKCSSTSCWPEKHFFHEFWKLYIMVSLKVDEIGVPVVQKERPKRRSVGARSASDKKVVPRFIQDKIRIASLVYGPDYRLETGSSS